MTVATQRLLPSSSARRTEHTSFKAGIAHALGTALRHELPQLAGLHNRMLERGAGVLSSHAKWRSLVVPTPDVPKPAELAACDGDDDDDGAPPGACGGGRYRPRAELLRRTFDVDVDVETCSNCGGRMRLLVGISLREHGLPEAGVLARRIQEVDGRRRAALGLERNRGDRDLAEKAMPTPAKRREYSAMSQRRATGEAIARSSDDTNDPRSVPAQCQAWQRD